MTALPGQYFSSIKRALRVIPERDKKKISLVIVLQVLLGLMDLAGVAAIGVLGALAVSGIQSQTPGNRVENVLNILHLGNLDFQEQAAALGILASIILVSRTIFSILITRRIYFFLSRRGAMISSEMLSKLLSRPLTKVYSRSVQDNLYSMTTGVSAITLSVLGSAIVMIADGSLLLILLAGLAYVDIAIAFTTFLFFGALGWVLYRIMNVRSQSLGRMNSELTITSNKKIMEVLDSYRETVVHNRRNFYSTEVRNIRLELSDVLAETQFLPNVSKYILESGIVLGAVMIAGAQFLLQDARHAIATLAVFLASGSRIAPAVMRIQQSAIQIKSGLGAAEPTLSLLEELREIDCPIDQDSRLEFKYEEFNPTIEISGISLQYPGSDSLALDDISWAVSAGEAVAIVGPSGSGKTSLVDVILGLLPATSGKVTISGLPPLEAVAKWPGAISYVPQDVNIVEGSFRDNVALGYPSETATDDLVWSALEKAQLAEQVRNSELGLDTLVGENGTKLSGGQRQRLGIARALFTKPLLLVLDEATSALDGITEFELINALDRLRNQVTVVTIAHRLSTVRHANQIIYLNNGVAAAVGNFDEVRSQIPDFDKQAQLMGL